VLTLSHPNDDILRTKCKEFDFSNPPFEPIEFAKKMIKFMYDHNGIGLAANQIGYDLRIFCMRGEPENFVCFNPKVIYHGADPIVILEEGCITYPGLIIPIKRNKNIRVRFQTPNGDTLTKTFSDLTARVVQHEITHLDGQVFWDGISRIQFERAKKKSGINVTFNGMTLEKKKINKNAGFIGKSLV
jgi:peptide deformylase